MYVKGTNSNWKQLVLAFKYFFSWSRDNNSLRTFVNDTVTRSYRICSAYSFNPPQDLHDNSID